MRLILKPRSSESVLDWWSLSWLRKLKCACVSVSKAVIHISIKKVALVVFHARLINSFIDTNHVLWSLLVTAANAIFCLFVDDSLNIISTRNDMHQWRVSGTGRTNDGQNKY